MGIYRRPMFVVLTLMSIMNLSLTAAYSWRIHDFRLIPLLTMGIGVAGAWMLIFQEHRRISPVAEEDHQQRTYLRMSILVLWINLVVGAGISLLQLTQTSHP
ncbi:MAG: hypothetical protein ACLQDC_04000 [Verrucomicrobiia bacterium]